MKAVISWISYLLSMPFFALTVLGILFTYVFFYPSSFLRTFSAEVHENDYLSYKVAAKRAFSGMGKEDLF